MDNKGNFLQKINNFQTQWNPSATDTNICKAVTSSSGPESEQ